ncbi:MAG: FAD-binding protein [Lachnospiraceae bacterium]|nr:FAD-binding protein [Lachnospiraceae bacterium]
MIQIRDLSLPFDHTEEEFQKAVADTLHISKEEILSFQLLRRSIDARKQTVRFVYTIAVSVKKEESALHRCRKNSAVTQYVPEAYSFVPTGTKTLAHRPVVVGSGPAGLFCALSLAKAGYKPILLERGDDVDTRADKVTAFWSGDAPLDPSSNVQFGEGGAGTFSDGKLNTMVKDPHHRGRKVLETFVSYGAPQEILYLQKPHIGTDHLKVIVKRMRQEIETLGGEVRFRSQMTEIKMKEGHLTGLVLSSGEVLPCEVAVLALGHSARDTFEMLYQCGLSMEAKSFAVGLRVEHPQEMIGRAQYKDAYAKLPPADYKVTHQTSTGRGVYSFCMCPGGFVVNASSEPGRIAVNGMSNYLRDGKNANSAIVVTVSPKDYHGEDVLAGMYYQRRLEEAAYAAGEGQIPLQRLDDFLLHRKTTELGEVLPNIKGGYTLCNLRDAVPDYLGDAIAEGMSAFGRKIKGFDRPDALFSGIESRTSSPIRMNRDDTLQSNIAGVYPCGEGAGYAGGITSAAMDGLRVYEAIATFYAPLKSR